MKKILLKTPITVWTLLVILAICVFAMWLHRGSHNALLSEPMDLASKIVTILGVYFLAVQVNKQTKSNDITNEFLNQSNFEIYGFCRTKINNEKPVLCCEPGTFNYNHCSDIHWFDYKQTGNLPAKDIKVFLIHNIEKEDITELQAKRTLNEVIQYKNDTHQYKLGEHAIPISLLDKTKNDKLYVLMEYKSVYTDISYKRIYSIEYAPSVDLNSTPITWRENIRYFESKTTNICDSQTITLNQTFKSIWSGFLIRIGLKKKISMEDWLIDFL